MQVIRAKNISGQPQTLAGKQFAVDEEYTIEAQQLPKWNTSDAVISAIVAGTFQIGDANSWLNTITRQIDWLKGNFQEIAIQGVAVEANRLQSMDNRVPNGFSVYVTGRGDDIANGIYSAGTRLRFNMSTTEHEFQMLDHYYAIAANAHWGMSCTIDNYFNALLFAPATTHGVNQAGDFIKYNIGTGNIFVPITPGAGNWDLDLTAKHPNTNILKCAMVPVPGNTGWFDYDATTNVITPNYTMTGGYHIMDYDVPLHRFGESIWGIENGITGVDVTGLVGKLLYNFWKIRINLAKEGGTLSSENANVVFTLATKRNV